MFTELLMPGRPTPDDVQLDAPTSRAISTGIGEKLRQSLGAEAPFPDRLQRLLDAMRDREGSTTGAGGKLG